MTAALLDRLTHHCAIFEMNGESYRFRASRDENEEESESRMRCCDRFCPERPF